MTKPPSTNGDHSQGQHHSYGGTFRQVVLPMLAALLIGIIAFVLIVISGEAGISSAADVSLVVVAFVTLLLCLIPLLLILGSLFGMGWLLRIVPTYAHVVRNASERAFHFTERATQRLSAAAISVVMGLSVARWVANLKKDDRDNSS